MIDLLSPLVEPFERVAIETVGVWYACSLVSMYAVAYVTENILGFQVTPDGSIFPDNFDLKDKLISAGIIAPIVEEGGFRILPALLFGATASIITTTSVIWALVHGRRGIVILPLVPIFVKLTLAGFFVEMIVLHVVHNTALVLASTILGE